ncbi:hypothetical protein BU17DRAFT_63002 [Hysterangium stoloniferum]|nr:hypothetical protein BU17DRAFT_63002 [Hysterangium stoloniferum]
MVMKVVEECFTVKQARGNKNASGQYRGMKIFHPDPDAIRDTITSCDNRRSEEGPSLTSVIETTLPLSAEQRMASELISSSQAHTAKGMWKRREVNLLLKLVIMFKFFEVIEEPGGGYGWVPWPSGQHMHYEQRIDAGVDVVERITEDEIFDNWGIANNGCISLKNDIPQLSDIRYAKELANLR